MGKERSSGLLPLHSQLQRESSSSQTSRSSFSLTPSPTPLQRSASQRIRSIVERNKTTLQVENEVTNALAARAYHLPGYNYCQDLAQYLVNNHLVFGLCCKHKKHPLSTRIRALNLLGSALFGLAVTNIIWLGYIYYNEDPDSVLFKVNFEDSPNLNATNHNNNNNNTDDDAGIEVTLPGPKDHEQAEQLGNTLRITKGMLLLWTLGGSLHAVYDSTIWYASACACCLPGNPCDRFSHLRGMGGYLTFFVVVLVTAVATFAVVLRATLMSNENIGSGSVVEDATHVGEGVKDLGVFEFVISYFVEFVLALFLYYPLFGTVLFSGILGCGKVPMLGGRPYEMRQLEKRAGSSSG